MATPIETIESNEIPFHHLPKHMPESSAMYKCFVADMQGFLGRQFERRRNMKCKYPCSQLICYQGYFGNVTR